MIDSFSDTYAFLSNFFSSSIVYEGIEYPTVEHAFQAAKTLSVELRLLISKLPAPGQAKRVGRSLLLRSDWNTIRVSVMSELVALKFQAPELRCKLLVTGDEELVEGNYWQDTFWGVCNGKGENHLGKILMETRARIRMEVNNATDSNI